MYVFIDESGDSGFKKGSSPFLVFSFICFRSTNEIEQVSRILDEFKHRNGFSKHWEFKFNKTSKRYILKMAKILASRDFCIKFFVINKLLIPNSLNYSYEDFLSFALRTFPEKDLFLYIDGNAIRKVKKRISPKLRNAASVKRIKFVDSKKSNLIQIADVTAGACNRYHLNNDDIVYKAFEKKITNVEIFDPMSYSKKS